MYHSCLFSKVQFVQPLKRSFCYSINNINRFNRRERLKMLFYCHKNSFSISGTSWQKHKTSLPKQRNNTLSGKNEYLFGVGPCYLALMSGRRTILNIYMRDGAINTDRPEFLEIKKKAKLLGLPILPATRKKLSALSEGRPAQNIVMEVSPLKFSRFDHVGEQISSDKLNCNGDLELWLALDEVQDPMNFGAILRSSSLLGVAGVVVPKQNSAPLSPVVSKASAGAMETMDIFQVPDMLSFLQERSSAGWDILGAVHPNSSGKFDVQPISCTDYKMNRPAVLVLGNEGLGLQEKVLQQCTQLISIFPPSSQTTTTLAGPDSFNVSVATGILLFSILRDQGKT